MGLAAAIVEKTEAAVTTAAEMTKEAVTEAAMMAAIEAAET